MFEMMFPEEEQREKVARCEPLTLVWSLFTLSLVVEPRSNPQWDRLWWK
jgi:hypothetical protein